jgi:hypothetical protein
VIGHETTQQQAVMIEEWNSGKEARTRVGIEEFGGKTAE